MAQPPVPDSAAIPALPGFDLDRRALVTPEASVFLRGKDLVVGPAFGPPLTVMNFVKAALDRGPALPVSAPV